MRELRSRRGEEWGAPELRPGGVRLRTLTKRGHGQAEHRRPEPGCPVGMWRSWDSGGGHRIEAAPRQQDRRTSDRGGGEEGRRERHRGLLVSGADGNGRWRPGLGKQPEGEMSGPLELRRGAWR